MQGRLEHEIKLNKYIDNRIKDMPYYVSEWNTNMKASEKTAATRKNFINRIIKFLGFFEEKTGSTDLNNLSTGLIEEYLIENQTKTDKNGDVSYTSDSHKRSEWCCLNNFIGFLYSRKYIDCNYMDGIGKPKDKDLDRINKHRVLLTKKDFKKIISSINPNNNNIFEFQYGKRDMAMMLLLMKTGMRETALTEINDSDINFDDNNIYIVDKGNKEHVYVMDDNLYDALWTWHKYKNDHFENNDAFFINEKGKRLSQNGVAFIVKRYTKEALGKELSPHKLRAGFCSILYKETGDAEFVRRAVGHSNIATTQRYINTGGEEKERASKIMSFI